MLKPVTTTKWTFKCDAPLGFGFYGDDVFEDAAIADTEEQARHIILAAYGYNYERFLRLLKSEPITLFDPKPNYVFENKTLRMAGPKPQRDNYED
jgi:hypothetical protein